MKKQLVTMFLTAGLLGSLPAYGVVTIGGINFGDNAFADSLISSSGTFTTSGGSVASVLTDINEGTYAFSFTSGGYVQLGFVDNLLVNGAGTDLTIFELGVPDSVKVALSVGGSSITYATSGTGFFAGGFSLNAVSIDLSDLGVAAGASLSSIVIGMDVQAPGGTVPSVSLVAAKNSGPVNGVPDAGSTTGAMLLSAMGAFAAFRRRLG